MYRASPDRYQEMEYRRCGRSGILLPAISLGLWHNFGGDASPHTMRSLICRSFNAGITHFDLANNYGPPPGTAEINFGRILSGELRHHRDELIISTKAGYTMWDGPYGDHGSRKYLLASLDQSLHRMKLDYVDIFYSHRPDPGTPVGETMGALHTAVQQGKALYAGISNYDERQTETAIDVLGQMGTPCLIHQAKYSMLNRWVEKGLLEVLEKKGTGCIAFSPLAQGLLTEKYLRGIPAGSRASKPNGFLKKEHIQPEILDKVKALSVIAGKRGQTTAQMALSWLLRKPGICSVLIGASNITQLLENIQCLRNPAFSEEELISVDKILGS